MNSPDTATIDAAARPWSALRPLAEALHRQDVPWLLGGSALLAAIGIDVEVGDLDLTVPEDALEQVQAACERWGPRTSVGDPPPPWCSAWLVTANIGDVEVEVIGGMCVRTPAGPRPLPQDLHGHLDVDGVDVPLADPAVWWWIYRGYKPERAALLASAAVFRARSMVTTRSAITPSGNGTITAIGMSRPALMSSARPAPISTTASVVRSTAGSTRTDQWLPSHTPGTEPSRIVPAAPLAQFEIRLSPSATPEPLLRGWCCSHFVT
jgi:hypothetical protein